MLMQFLSVVRRVMHTVSPGLLAGMLALGLVAYDRRHSTKAAEQPGAAVAVAWSDDFRSTSAGISLPEECELTDYSTEGRTIIVVRRNAVALSHLP